MRYLPVFISLFGFLCSSASWAATVEVQGGEVFIDRGNGYSPVTGSSPAKPGDVVMAKVGGSAIIVYGEGCVQNVEVGSVVTVTESPPCALLSPEPNYTLILGGVAVAGGVAAAIALSGDDDKPASGE